MTPKVKTLAEFSRQLTLEKPGTIVSSQDIQVTSQANGKVARILVKEGDTVKGGQPIVQLSDTIASYKFQAERAKKSNSNQDTDRNDTQSADSAVRKCLQASSASLSICTKNFRDRSKTSRTWTFRSRESV